MTYLDGWKEDYCLLNISNKFIHYSVFMQSMDWIPVYFIIFAWGISMNVQTKIIYAIKASDILNQHT